MGVRVINDASEGLAALYDSVSGFAFGPTFHDSGHTDAGTAALCFLRWSESRGDPDPRAMAGDVLEARSVEWLNAIAGGTWTGDLDGECALCHGDLDVAEQASEPERFDMSGPPQHQGQER